MFLPKINLDSVDLELMQDMGGALSGLVNCACPEALLPISDVMLSVPQAPWINDQIVQMLPVA